MTKKETLVISDERWLAKLEQKALVPNYNSSATFGRTDGRCSNCDKSPIEIEDEDEIFVNENDPEFNIATLGGYEWEEHGFHVSSNLFNLGMT